MGIGDDIDKSELEKIASSPDNVFTVKTFDELEDKVHQIKRGFCIGITQISFSNNLHLIGTFHLSFFILVALVALVGRR